METLLSSGVSTSYLIKMLIKKQQKRSLGTSAKGLFSALLSGVSSRQEAAVREAAAYIVSPPRSAPNHPNSLPLSLALNSCLQASSCGFQTNNTDACNFPCFD